MREIGTPVQEVASWEIEDAFVEGGARFELDVAIVPKDSKISGRFKDHPDHLDVQIVREENGDLEVTVVMTATWKRDA